MSEENNTPNCECNNNSLTKIEISKSYYDQESLFREMAYKEPPEKSCFKQLCKSLNVANFKSFIIATFPILTWLFSYKRGYLFGDVIAGCTVAVMHIPQGMAYGLLANLPAVTGIYMAFFPVLMYIIFGTSRHNSMGSFAVIALMVGQVVIAYSYQFSDSPVAQDAQYSPLEVAILVCFIVGAIQLLMYVFRLGVLSFLLSECLVSGFTTGAAVHVLTSQIKDILGITLPSIEGNFTVIKTFIAIFQEIHNTNFAALLISTITISILILNNEVLKPRLAKKTAVPVPIELIVIVMGTLFSRFLDWNNKWDISLVGSIPTGLPNPISPRFNLWFELFVPSLTIAFVSYSVSVSMALIIAQKLKYDIDFNQELLAMGTGNIFGSFFSCFPFSTSLSRSLVQQTVGGNTQLTSAISCGILLIVLLWIGPFFETLPKCILASIIIVALKGMLMQVGDFSRYKRKSSMSALIWMVTFLSVVLISIDIGLLIGIILSTTKIFLNGIAAHYSILGNAPNSDLFLDVECFEKANEIRGKKIIKFSGNINFATKTSFKKRILELLKLDLIKSLKNVESAKVEFKHLILDFNALTNIDAPSVSMLIELIKDLNKLGTKVSIVCCSTRIYKIFIQCEFDFIKQIYPTVRDAINHVEITRL